MSDFQRKNRPIAGGVAGSGATHPELLGRTEEVPAVALPSQVRAKPADASPVFSEPVLPMREIQRRYAVWAYEHLGGRKLLTAEKLGIDDKTLTSWLAKKETRD